MMAESNIPASESQNMAKSTQQNLKSRLYTPKRKPLVRNPDSFKQKETYISIVGKKPKPSASFPFLNLPRELRDHIYDYFIGSKYLWRVNHHDQVVDHNLIRVNHQIREEYLDMVFGRAHVNVRLSGADRFETIGIPESLKPKVKRLQVFLVNKDSADDCHWGEILSDAYGYLSRFQNLQHLAVEFRASVDKWWTTDMESKFLELWNQHPIKSLTAVNDIKFVLGNLGGHIDCPTWKYHFRFENKDGKRIEHEERAHNAGYDPFG